MPDDEQTEPAADERDDEATPEESHGPSISAYGIASAVLGALSVAAIVLGWFIYDALCRMFEQNEFVLWTSI